MTTRTVSRPLSVAVAVVAVLGLSACTGGSPTRTASASATAAPIGTRVAETCSDLVPESAFAVYRKSFTLDAGVEPAAGTPGATIAAQRGRVCTYRQTGGDTTVTVAVAHLPEKTLTRLKNSLFESSNSVPTYTVEGYFDRPGAIGRADAFADPYWIDARSTMFGEPGDAQPVVDAVRLALTNDLH